MNKKLSKMNLKTSRSRTMLLPLGEDNPLPPRSLIMDVCTTHDRRTSQHTNGTLNLSRLSYTRKYIGLTTDSVRG